MQDVHLFGKKAILYSRVSTKEQEETGFSLDHQETQLRRFCQENGISIVESYREAHSAKSFDRPKFNEIFEFCTKNKGKVDLILTVKWDRFSRNVMGAQLMLVELQKFGVSINAIHEWKNLDDPTDWFMHLITMGTAQHENLQKSDRVKSGNHRAGEVGR